MAGFHNFPQSILSNAQCQPCMKRQTENSQYQCNQNKFISIELSAMR
jgi:hypothetical protein